MDPQRGEGGVEIYPGVGHRVACPQGWHVHRAGRCAGHGAGQRGGGHFLVGGAGDFFLIIQESLIFRTGGITLGMTRYSVMNLTFG